jgi:hypothetical protein
MIERIKDTNVSPAVMKTIHGWLTFAWFLMMPIALATGWVASVVFISVISIYANFAGHFSSWQASRVEVNQEKEEQKRDDDAPERIEKKIDKIDDKV